MGKKKKKQRTEPGEDLRLNPETRLAPRFDSAGIAKFPVAEPGEMGRCNAGDQSTDARRRMAGRSFSG